MNTVQKRILVVDDEKLVRELFCAIISSGIPDTQVDVASNGLEALTLCRDLDYKVILMDVVMPVMNGETAFEEIRKLCSDSNRDMPSVIFCTGYNPTVNIQTYTVSAGKHCVLHKPVPSATLIEVINKRLDAK